MSDPHPPIPLPPAVEVVCHRGTGQRFVRPDAPPENTLAAFEQAWAEGADACELDVHLTSDGKLVVIHDDTTDRTTNANWIVAQHTLAELQQLDAGRWKGRQWAGQRLPTLSQVLATIPDGRRLFIELKLGWPVVPALVQDLEASGKRPEQIVIIGFDIDGVSAAKAALGPAYTCLLLVVFEMDYNAGRWQMAYDEGPVFRTVKEPADLDNLVAMVRDAGLDGVDVSFAQPGILAPRMRAEGLDTVVWTVDDGDVAVEMARRGITSITTDDHQLIRDSLHREGIRTGPRGGQRLSVPIAAGS